MSFSDQKPGFIRSDVLTLYVLVFIFSAVQIASPSIHVSNPTRATWRRIMRCLNISPAPPSSSSAKHRRLVVHQIYTLKMPCASLCGSALSLEAEEKHAHVSSFGICVQNTTRTNAYANSSRSSDSHIALLQRWECIEMRNMVRSCFEALTTPMHVCAFETKEKKSSWSSLRDPRVFNSLDCTPPSFSTHISAGNDRIDSNIRQDIRYSPCPELCFRSDALETRDRLCDVHCVCKLGTGDAASARSQV